VIERYLVIKERVRRELNEIERVVARVERALVRAQHNAEDADLYVDSIALNLHDFYVGLERIFELIAANLDRSAPASSDWHRDLFLQMTIALPQIRPRVLSEETAAALDEYRRFRHVVRHVYAFEFDPSRIYALAHKLQPTWERARVDLLAFTHFLEDLSRSA